MALEISVECNIDVKSIAEKVHDKRFWTFTASEWHRLYGKYVPMDNGILVNQVVITATKDGGEIEHTVPYARRIYNGSFHFKTNKHPLAGKEWDKAAEPTQKPKLIKEMQSYIDSGRIKF